jgi:hypothetical protein
VVVFFFEVFCAKEEIAANRNMEKRKVLMGKNFTG